MHISNHYVVHVQLMLHVKYISVKLGAKLNIIHSGTKRRTQHHFCDLSSNDEQPESNHEKTTDKPKMRDRLQNS